MKWGRARTEMGLEDAVGRGESSPTALAWTSVLTEVSSLQRKLAEAEAELRGVRQENEVWQSSRPASVK